MGGENRRARLRALLTLAGAKGAQFAAFDAAFVHESAVGERLAERSNERLEFLGDAVLGAIVARSLFARYPAATEGELALRKSGLVADAALCETAERLGFEALLVTSASLAHQPFERRRALLADAFEAFVAVLAAECGDAIATAFVAREHIAERERIAPAAGDPKTILQEWSQRRFRVVPTYSERFEGPDHERTFHATVAVDDVTAQGVGPSKRAAQREAAAAALALLRERYDDVMPPPLSGQTPRTARKAAGAAVPTHAPTLRARKARKRRASLPKKARV